MLTVNSLNIGSKYMIGDQWYIKNDDGTHSPIQKRGTNWVAEKTKTPYDPRQEIQRFYDAPKQRPKERQLVVATKPSENILLECMDQDGWNEHSKLLRTFRQKCRTVTDAEYLVLLQKLERSGVVRRERKPAGRKMCFHYQLTHQL